MKNETEFTRMVVEAVENGFVMTIETESDEKIFVYPNTAKALTAVRKLMRDLGKD